MENPEVVTNNVPVSDSLTSGTFTFFGMEFKKMHVFVVVGLVALAVVYFLWKKFSSKKEEKMEDEENEEVSQEEFEEAEENFADQAEEVEEEDNE